MKKHLLFIALLIGQQAFASNCIDPEQIDETMICLQIYDPVCGCDGVTYDNDCYATYYGGVTSYTPGECSTSDPGECPELDAELDFGLCDMVIGVALVNNECVTLSGCGTVASDGMDYAAYFYGNPSECDACIDSGEECINPDQIDLDWSCPFIWSPVCGCDGETYGNDCEAFYYGGVTSWEEGACNQSVEPCADLTTIDFGDCELFLGYGKIDGTCTPVSGCDYIVDGVDYSNALFSTLDECTEVCNKFADPCTDLADVDFGLCDMFMGYGVVDFLCQGISGCGSFADGIEYNAALYSTMEECELCLASDCINPDQIDETMICIEIYDPVCGCDGVTYDNDCYAFYYGGVTSWTEGECLPVGIQEESGMFNIRAQEGFQIYLHNLATVESLVIYNLSGKMIGQFGPMQPGEHMMQLSIHTPGVYIFHARGERSVETGKLFVR